MPGEVGGEPRRLLGSDALERGGDHRFGVDRFGAGKAALAAGEPVEAVPRCPGLGLPVGPQHGGIDGVVLARPARGDRPPLQHVQVAGTGLGAVVLVGPAGDQLGELGLDLPRPLREHLGQPLRHAHQAACPDPSGTGSHARPRRPASSERSAAS